MISNSLCRELNSSLTCYLHIYKVVHATDQNGQTFQYVSVASIGKDRQTAEKVAINLVHQRGYHIVATDTATAAPWLSQDTDLPLSLIHI